MGGLLRMRPCWLLLGVAAPVAPLVRVDADRLQDVASEESDNADKAVLDVDPVEGAQPRRKRPRWGRDPRRAFRMWNNLAGPSLSLQELQDWTASSAAEPGKAVAPGPGSGTRLDSHGVQASVRARQAEFLVAERALLR